MLALGFRHKLIFGLASACLVLLVVARLTYTTLARNATDREWVSHTLTVLDKLNDLQFEIGNAEDNQRGFLLTSNSIDFDSYQSALAQIPVTLLVIRHLTSDNLSQQAKVNRLEANVSARLTVLREGIDTRDRDGLPVAQALISTGFGRELMNSIRVDIGRMKDEENQLLAIRNGEVDFTTRRAKLFIIVGEALGFCFLLIAGAIVQQEMTKRRQIEQEIRRLNTDLERRVADRTRELATRSQDLERSNIELQQFAYVASHDLQEPLRTISSFTQLLAKRYREQLDDKAREFIDFAVDGCKRMQTLINDLLAFSRVGSGSKSLEPTRCDAVLDRALRNLRVAIQESRARIERAPLPVVMADEVQLAQLFQNLIGNAIKFHGQEPPHIQISGRRHDAFWTISIRDNGIGISPEHSDRIFVIFQRLHTSAQYSGTGIGLAVCKKIAERHGGSISVQPAPGGGSIFSFTMSAGEIDHASSEEKAHAKLRRNAAAH
jgi:signal transduction histidine kinase